MCGIAGILDYNQRPLLGDLEPMVEIQRHRGPDASGWLVDGPLAMGMRRLSIIDLAGGDQPIYNEDRSLATVFNGEIYNYLELREQLGRRGHRFGTRSDTEVLLHLYEESGADMVPRLNGMFGFALWDRTNRSLFLARDRMGVKPLYYAQAGGRWLFASELKALLARPELDTELDLDALADYLRLGYIPRDATPYRKVRRLLPGHSLLIRPEGSTIRRWWDLAEFGQNRADERSESLEQGSLEQMLELVFDDAVRLRMRSDVPVASFLSGGLDSSLVTVTAQHQSPIPMHTFTLGFEHTAFDETPYARAVAEHAGTSHHELVVKVRDAVDLLPQLMWHMDEPMGDSSIIPNYLISRFAAENVKVCLSGLGGDELFGGYARYLTGEPGRIRRMFSEFPALARILAAPVDRFSYSWAEELRLAGDAAFAYRSYLHRLQIFDTPALRSLGFPATGHAEQTVEMLWNRYPGRDPVGRRQFIDQHTYLPDQILALTDRMSMANSLEVRTPFMDYRLVRFSQGIGADLKQKAGDFKILLKQALGRRCPPELLNRPKWGFDTPLSRWVAQPAILELLRRLPEGKLVSEGLVKPAAIRAMVNTPESASRFGRRLWALLVLEVWYGIGRNASPAGAGLADAVSR